MTSIAVDPVEAVIKLAQADSDLATATNSQIANRHRYGQDSGDWAYKSQSLIVQPASGQPNIYNGVQRLLLQARCYGETPAKAAEVWKGLQGLTRVERRRTVAVTPGTALVYFVVAQSAPIQLFDEDLSMPFYQVNLLASVAEDLVS